MSKKQTIFKGDRFNTKTSGIALVLDYISSGEVIVKFESTGNIKSVIGSKLRNGYVKDPMSLSMYGVACLGNGKFKTNENRKAFRNFQNMLQRCYSDTYQDNNFRKSYHNAFVCKEWLNFQNFCKWHIENYIEGYALDKDWSELGNKEYSPEKCFYIPTWLNNLILDNELIRSSSGIGVEKIINNNGIKYKSFFKKDGVKIDCGRYDTAEEAIEKRSFEKSKHIIECSKRKDVPKKIIPFMIKMSENIKNVKRK